MNYSLGEREIELRNAAFEVGRISFGLSFEERWKTASTQGLVALPIPQEFGGPGLNVVETAISIEGFSEGCSDGGFTFSMAAHLLAGVIPILNHGSTELKKRILRKVSDGEFILANAMTEVHSGSNAFGMKTVAIANGDNYLLRGSKTFCTNAPIANGILVYALTDEAKGFFGGITCFLLEKGKHNYTCGKTIEKSGLHSSPMAEVFLDNVVVSKENIIGKVGSGAMLFLESMNWERTCMSAMHLGTMIRLCNITREYIKSRILSGNTLDQHQAVQFRIAEMFLQTEISKMLTYKSAFLMELGEEVTESAARAKIFSSEALIKVAQDAMILHGANGFTLDFGISEILADAQGSLIYSGPNDVLRNLISSRL